MSNVPKTPVRLDDECVAYTPRLIDQVRGRSAWSLPYRHIESVRLIEPSGLRPGRLELVSRPTSPQTPRIEFRQGNLKLMRRLYADLWARVRRAHGRE
jgi:hypothetical protein